MQRDEALVVGDLQKGTAVSTSRLATGNAARLGRGGGVSIPPNNRATVQPLWRGQHLKLIGQRITEDESRRSPFSIFEVAEITPVQRISDTAGDGRLVQI